MVKTNDKFPFDFLMLKIRSLQNGLDTLEDRVNEIEEVIDDLEPEDKEE